jgi:nucleotide-binding universal stress UspA family protein
MFTFMITGEPSGNREQASRRVIIVGVDDSAEAEAAARWAVREAELRKADVLVVGVPYRGREWTRWIRSVARAVLEQSACPVAVIPQQHPGLGIPD